MNETESKHKTWTDTSYSLSSNDLLYISNATHSEAVALKCPGYSRDGKGFAIEFQMQHLDILKNLVAELENLKAAK
ncbi:MAG: hypothetical protein F6K22_02105 [Okeania sp. SIO2F4]|uniref:hypothetical protein n=1 Tax=Okeania sp. SIO2F4 TaxID=2607790 RepID=UPI00142D198E|nr:hypothetical protein [Okeania sp. SIO2F4]NES01719.1 hypothetical protein [Okeania sp. SIO2F4]